MNPPERPITTPAVPTHPPFKLEGLVWSMDGVVARTGDLTVAKLAHASTMATGREPLYLTDKSEDLGDGVYRFVYVRVNEFGDRQREQDPLTIYYFAPNPQVQPYSGLVDGDGNLQYGFDSRDEAEVENRKHGGIFGLIFYLG